MTRGVSSLLLLRGFRDEIQVVGLGDWCFYPLGHCVGSWVTFFRGMHQ